MAGDGDGVTKVGGEGGYDAGDIAKAPLHAEYKTSYASTDCWQMLGIPPFY